jgi:hypothetical protein
LQLSAQVPQGGTATVRNLLWTYSGTANYTFGNLPAWLSIAAPSGTAGPLGQEVVLQLNAANMVPGIYTALVQATAPGYSTATATVQLTVTAASVNPVVFAVNAGGAAYTAANGQVFEADRAFTGGEVYSTSSSIAGTNDDALYQDERYGDFNYAIALPNGTYDVTFKLAEIYFAAAGQRVFDVAAEGQEIITDLDIYAGVGQNNVLDIKRTITVTDNELNLTFRADVNRAKLAALLVESVGQRGATAVTRKEKPNGNLFPNPVTASAKTVLRFNAPTKQPTRVEVITSYGRPVWSATHQAVKGVNELEIKTEKLVRGIYYVRLYLMEGTISEKMVVAE